MSKEVSEKIQELIDEANSGTASLGRLNEQFKEALNLLKELADNKMQ